ncbi:Similar to Metacaspase-1A; acc. no. B0XPP3 [Pyronema omphalodes CBS 100304]|uniref:Similar to Metacaspase-1A acc. no. B0XPP3 n=1 Tax=Pyronema omphalodes (strain CBS 100304) TaxID=1076935 RepID=U4LW63_PYROM|nr:Similar to Metacaspase-1A; acc. no. B0XPP3 [Pyronema omphalodes CBS 100304]
MSGGYPGQYSGYPGQHHGQHPQYPPQQQYPPQGYPPQQGYYPPPNSAPPQGYYPPPAGAPPQQGGYYPPPGSAPPQQWAPPPQGYPQQQSMTPTTHRGNNSDRNKVPTYQNAYVNHQPGAPPPPPTGQTSFGVPGSDYSYSYSNCSGKRKALLIGINYFGQKGQLRGCINDVKNMSKFLHDRFQYKWDDMVILTDDQQHPKSQPTKQNILAAMHWLVKDAQPNDSLFFHYSGHGGQTKDLDGDEGDGYDETIYPLDFRYTGHIVDDEMHRIMVQPLKPGVRLTAIFDSCHSGSVLDLPYLYSTSGKQKEPNLAREAGMGLFGALQAYSKGDLNGVAASAMSIAKRLTTGRSAEEKAMRTKTSPADVIQWSGSKDSQTSADATEGGQATGAMSYAFIKALTKNPQQSYAQLLNSIRDELSQKYSQKPQLSCSHPLDTNLLYVM